MVTEQAVRRSTAIPGRSVETQLLIDALKTGKPQDVFTDEQLMKICGHDTRPNHKGYCYLMSAINYVLKHYDVCWSRIRSENRIECLNADGCRNATQTHVDAIHRRAIHSKRLLEVSSAIETDPKKRVETNRLVAQIGTLAFLSTNEAKQKVFSNIEKEHDRSFLTKLISG